MQLKWKSGISILMLFLFLFAGSGCSSRKKHCSGNVPTKSSYNKRNKNNYSKRYSNKSRSVKKDYVIRNGIAN